MSIGGLYFCSFTPYIVLVTVDVDVVVFVFVIVFIPSITVDEAAPVPVLFTVDIIDTLCKGVLFNNKLDIGKLIAASVVVLTPGTVINENKFPAHVVTDLPITDVDVVIALASDKVVIELTPLEAALIF